MVQSSSREDRNTEAILSHLDVPAEPQLTVVDTCVIRGWACSVNSIAGVEIFVDGARVQRFVPDSDRPDVAAVYPKVPGAHRSGFDVTVVLGPLSQGLHQMEVVIRDRAGNQRRHSRLLQVHVDPYHRVLMEKQLRGHEREALLDSLSATGRTPHFELWIDGRAGDDISSTQHSVAQQTYRSWSCHIVTGAASGMPSSTIPTLIEDTRWHASFAAAISDDGDDNDDDYVAFLLAGDRLLPDALLHLASHLAGAPASLVYSDHDLVEPTGVHTDPNHAPDWSPEHLYARNYVGGVFFVRKDELRRHPFDAVGAAWRYDLLLRVTEAARRIAHVPRVLWSSPSPAQRSAARAEAERLAVAEALQRRGVKADVIALSGVPVRRVRRLPPSTPIVSIIVPTTGRPGFVRMLVESLSRNCSYSRYELVFLDNGQGKYPDGIEYLRSKGFRIIEQNEPFNWARLNNVGARRCNGELLLFLNDDIEIVDPEWLQELVAQVLVPDVGTVGALLLYPDGRIQHGGIFLVDHGGGCRHHLQFIDPAQGCYQHLDRVTREVTASTGACLMIRREVFEGVGGFDEGFRIAFNDVDLCMRLLERGYRNVWTPHCRLVHHEGVSRKGTDISDDEQRVWSRWGARLKAGDSYHNPNLAKDRTDCAIDTSVLDRRQVPPQRDGDGPAINLIGYIRAEMGVGEGTRALARAMDAVGIPFVVIDYEHRSPARKGDTSFVHRIVERPVHDVNILYVNADLTPEACERLGTEVFDGRYTIGYWVWELPEWPDRWVSSFDHVDEVWVPSEFVREALVRTSPVPVTRIPHSVQKGPGPYYERPFFELPGGRFLFLTMYDTHSVMERKNPEGAIAAFREAFSPTDQGVGLVLKINNVDKRERKKIRALMGDHKNIYVIDRILSRHEVDSLLACCDSFVSLHRSEGFGLSVAEAMSLGKPVIATYWSGNVDFMDDTSAACVDFQLRSLGRSHGPYDAHQYWADPNIETAARWMRTLAADAATARRIGAAGQTNVRQKLSERTVGTLIRARLAQIHGARS